MDWSIDGSCTKKHYSQTCIRRDCLGPNDLSSVDKSLLNSEIKLYVVVACSKLRVPRYILENLKKIE